MKVLGINAVFHDSSAALVIDGEIVAAAEEERFTRRKHGKECVPFNAWEPPARAAAWCLEHGGVSPNEIDIVAHSYDPSLAIQLNGDISAHDWEPMRTMYAARMPSFINDVLPGIDRARTQFVPHHVAHAASAYLAAPFDHCAVLVVDGRGEKTSHLSGVVRDRHLKVISTQALPHSLGLFYEELTMHLGFRRSSDEYKVMGMAGYGTPRHLDRFRELVRVTDDGFTVQAIDWSEFAPRRSGEWAAVDPTHADLAASAQTRIEEVLLELVQQLHERTGETNLALAGGVALNCVANARLARESAFTRIFVQPAAGDAGTALGAALFAAREAGETIRPMTSAALGREWSDDAIERVLRDSALPYERPDDIAIAVADVIAENGVVGWFQGRSEYGPRALGHRSLLAHPGFSENLERLNNIKGREQFRPVAPMVLEERASEIFEGMLPSPYMLFTHRVHDTWTDRIASAVHVDGTARVQTVNGDDEPLVARMLEAFAERTEIPVVINTSFNTAGRPMVDAPSDALECFGSAAIDALALGPFLVRRSKAFGAVAA